jgi:hypothetical protein
MLLMNNFSHHINGKFSAQQWPEQIRVLLVAIPNLQLKKETPNEQVSVHT